MLSKKEVYKKATQLLQDRRRQQKIKAEENRLKAFTLDHEIQDIYNSMLNASAHLSKLIFTKECSNDAFKEEQKKIESIRSELENKLKKQGLPKDFLYEKPYCDKCFDRGYIEQKRCDCMKKAISQIMAEDLQSCSPLKLTSFLDFSLDYYPEEMDNTLGVSPKVQMKRVLQFCLEYSENFNKNSRGILMIGKTGLGKTHLSLAIAQRVIEEGYTVIYITASELTRRLSDQFFGKNPQEDLLEQICETDLLLIDDLGAEFESSYCVSALYDILSIRLSRNIPTIVNTNLTVEELQRRYGERIVSRLFSQFTPLAFTGEDIRMKREKF